MSVWGRISAELTIKSEEPAVMRAQLQALAKQLPFLYVMLCTNAIALAWTHVYVSPVFLTLVTPCLLIPICVIRAVAWRKLAIDTLDDTQVACQLRRTVILVAILGVSFTAWSFALFSYGNAYDKSHVAFFMSITVVGCIFCFIHLRPAALLLTAIVLIPFTIRFASSGEVVFVALAINFLLVSFVMILMMMEYYDDFRNLVRSRDRLAMIGEENLRAAEVDGLTGLANRRRFFKDISIALAEHALDGSPLALGIVDLDGFKPINDLHGHQVGDEVLCAVSRRLEACAGGQIKIARLGGDEFALLVPLGTSGDLQTLGDEICRAVSAPIRLASGVVRVTASIGFAVFPDMGRTVEELIERADFALYHVKDHERGTALVFSEGHAGEIRDRRQLEYELQNADLDHEFFVMFQPIVEIAENRITTFEALARWQSPNLGLVSPGAFIPAAERLGLVRRLTHALFRQACDAAREWPASVRLSFNLSVEDLVSDDAVGRLLGMVEQSGLLPDRLVFEVTETSVIRDFERANVTLRALRNLGCRIALDDFGTGYSSLGYVHRLPLDKLKIDRSFVSELMSDRSSQTIIASIIDLSTNLNLACIVEGVETPEQVFMLESMGCKTMQGYYFGKPMRADAVRRLLENYQTDPQPTRLYA